MCSSPSIYKWLTNLWEKKTSNSIFLSPDDYSLRLVTYRDLLARPPDSFSSYDMCNKLDEVSGCCIVVATQSGLQNRAIPDLAIYFIYATKNKDNDCYSSTQLLNVLVPSPRSDCIKIVLWLPLQHFLSPSIWLVLRVLTILVSSIQPCLNLCPPPLLFNVHTWK